MDVRNVVGWIIVPLALGALVIIGAAALGELSRGSLWVGIGYAFGALVAFAVLVIGWRLARKRGSSA